MPLETRRAYLNQQKMKTLLSLVAAGLLASTSIANASNEDLKDVATVVAKDQKVSLYLNQESGPVKVTLLDERGKVLAKSKIKDYDKDVVLPYNLENLPEGNYSLEVSSNEDQMIYDFTTTKSEFQPVAPKMMAYGKEIDNNSLRLTVIGLQEPGVEVTFREKFSNEVLLTEEVDQPEGFTKIYKFKNIDTSDVMVEIKDKKGTVKSLFF
ncbi:hypothetical protein A8938_0149 [Algoriphagus zhangzhouensis]|uniref:Por secretion system C-terminal sorting domain-containing protein n=2 Tax=Algoriphagus zhangzhouensis TaxID=1073327 RepID=A0A1M7Z3X7_9BACT|nr:hypothetical protein A8938_0149 [Algoriphagus zhangzhouensis]SHO59512.1 hypothetical protein SAMN04488108_0149 [Algoriphagus zhangzhouensis]